MKMVGNIPADFVIKQGCVVTQVPVDFYDTADNALSAKILNDWHSRKMLPSTRHEDYQVVIKDDVESCSEYDSIKCDVVHRKNIKKRLGVLKIPGFRYTSMRMDSRAGKGIIINHPKLARVVSRNTQEEIKDSFFCAIANQALKDEMMWEQHRGGKMNEVSEGGDGVDFPSSNLRDYVIEVEGNGVIAYNPAKFHRYVRCNIICMKGNREGRVFGFNMYEWFFVNVRQTRGSNKECGLECQ